MVFHLIMRHHLNVYDLSTLACDKIQLIQVRRQNHVLHNILNIARTDTLQYIYFEGIL